jgi:hypothetical protein
MSDLKAAEVKEALEWLIQNAFTQERIEQEDNEFDVFTNEGIYGYHTLSILLDGITTDMPAGYGSLSLLIEDEADKPRLVTIADHKGSVAMGLYKLIPKSEIAYTLLHFIVDIYKGSTLVSCLQYCTAEGFAPNPPHEVTYPMPWDESSDNAAHQPIDKEDSE